MKQLYELLEEYNKKDIYPFHMPGHKRIMDGGWLEEAYRMDITEIEGFDNLHHAQGLLKTAQEQAAILYHSEETLFLVNGSTCGILSAISASVSVGGTLLMARNCHKSAYNAVKLRQLEVEYLHPAIIEEFSIYGGIFPEEIEKSLKENETIEAVMITSPTMDGIVSDVEKIAKICHNYRKVLIVDEAHGAHFGFDGSFPKNSISLGADIVIHSLHKTLPSFTQTALLHINGLLANRIKVREFLAIYQTSSPSYLLMGSMDYCIQEMREGKEKLFLTMKQNLQVFHEMTSELRNIRILSKDIVGQYAVKDVDQGKLVISVKNTKTSGRALYELLYQRFHLQMEMAAEDYVLAIATLKDTKSGYERLANALIRIEKEVQKIGPKKTEVKKQKEIPKKAMYSIYQAGLRKTTSVRVEESKECVSAEFVYLYPPGVPILVPGEIITEYIRNQILSYKKQGLSLQGMEDLICNRISIIQ